MRPGPGLVVMALAFISGARRGSTSSISSKTITTTSSSPPTPPPQLLATTFPLTSSATLFQVTVKTSPSSSSSVSHILAPTSAPITTAGDTISTKSASIPTPTSTQLLKLYENIGSSGSKLVTEEPDDRKIHLSKWPEKGEPFNFLDTLFSRHFSNSFPSTSNYLAYTYQLPSHLTQFYDEHGDRTESKGVLHTAKHTRRANKKFRRRRKRRTRSANIESKGIGSDIGSEDVTENLNGSEDRVQTVVDTTLAHGLPVHFSPLTAADSSRSLDEDDIFALVAEDDLLSEESFDHLVKLTNDKIGDTNEEDYSSGTETVVESSSGSASGSVTGSIAPDNKHDASDQRHVIEVAVHKHQPEQYFQQMDKQNEHSQLQDDDRIASDDNDNDDNDDNDDDVDVNEGGNETHNEDHNSENDNLVDTVYNANLVGNSNEGVVSLKESDSIHSLYADASEKERRQVTTTTTSSSEHLKAELDNTNRYHTILESSFALTRLNPWISACDLAQPGPLPAPDLQGECSSGTLPVAWVDEGPGPPSCLKSCKEETPFTNKLNKDNMINYLINNNNNSKNNKNKNKNDNKLNKLVGYTTTTNTFNIKLRNSQPTISDSVNTNNINNINNKNIDNNKNNKNNNNIIHKLLNPFNYYQLNNKKMAKTRRNPKETSSATSWPHDVATKLTTMNVTQKDELKNAQSPAGLPLDSSETYELLLHDMLMQRDKTATNKKIEQDEHQFNAAVSVDRQWSQQQQQNLNKNNIVQMALTARNYNDNNSHHNNQNKQFELKHNYVKEDHLDSGNSNSNSNSNRYQNNNNINTEKRSDNSSPTRTLMTDNLSIANNLNNDRYLKIPPPEKEKQQCLEYMGDSDKTMPSHLCHTLTPSVRLAQLRKLRLRNCCERNVFSALHTLALNATLNGGAGCLRALEDLMELDALATRITCGLTEILFRFDCRQVYSIIHQCDDCKEAYRRWVCSTLVPYFAETSDIMKPPEILTTTIESTKAARARGSGDVKSSSPSYRSHKNSLHNNTITASNTTTSHITATMPNKLLNNYKNNGTDMPSVMALKQTITSNFITNSNTKQNDMQYDANNYLQHFYMIQQSQQLKQHNMKRRNVQQLQKRVERINNNHNNNNYTIVKDIYYKTFLIHPKQSPQQQQPEHSTTLALSFNDIISHNSTPASPRQHLGDDTTTPRQKRISEYNFHHKSTNKREKRSDNSITTTTIYADVVVNRPSMSSITSSSTSASTSTSISPSPLSSSSSSSSSSPSSSVLRRKQEQQQQSLKFISTANNEDSFYVENPVITKLLKRSKRKEFEFRKRRRIRPCLSVCQTVEQKCPYLLPADRAPSMPTQYAGEPTFLCLDYNVDETEEQLNRASHGTDDCCYTYCSNAADGICTYCDDMWAQTEFDREADVLGEDRELKVFNITMKAKAPGESAAAIRVETKIQKQMGEERNGLKMSTVAIMVRNDTTFENATRLAERLQYYAFCDGVFYYDDDAEAMPKYPNSESCRKLPPGQSRCSIPYYATNYISSADMLGSYRKNKEAQKLLLWLSTLLCLWSCYSARSMRVRGYSVSLNVSMDKSQHIKSKIIKTVNMCHRCQCQTRQIMQHERGMGYKENVIELWYGYGKSRVLVTYLLQSENVAQQERMECQKSKKEKFIIDRHLRGRLHSPSIKLNLKIFKIPTLTFLLNYKETFLLLLLLFKKRQKLRKRKLENFLSVDNGQMMDDNNVNDDGLNERSWSILRHTSCKNLRVEAKKFSFSKNKINYNHYYYDYDYDYNYDYDYDYDYDYCRCSQIFSYSCNTNVEMIINNNNNNNNNNNKNNFYNYNNYNDKYINKFKYNFSTCSFKYNTNNNKNLYNNNNNNNKNIIIMRLNYKEMYVIKYNITITTTRTTHKFIINSCNSKTDSFNVITIIVKIKTYNNDNNWHNNNNNILNKQMSSSFNLNPNPIGFHQHHNQHHDNYDSNNISCYNYSNYYYKLNRIVNNNNMILLKTSPFMFFTFLAIKLYSLLKKPIISTIILMIIMAIVKILIILLTPLMFRSFMKMKYNNNYHMENIIKLQLKLKFNYSPDNSYNSKRINYRYFYFYDFNMNDWWQRRQWWRRRRRLAVKQIVENPNYYYNITQSSSLSLLSSLRIDEKFFQKYLL